MSITMLVKLQQDAAKPIMHYTYLHRRASDEKPFYVGKGSGRRAFNKSSRSKFWKRVVEKHGLIVEIIANWPTEAEAFEHEKFLIACFRDMNFQLTNKLGGGEGISGWTHSEETKAKIRSTNAARWSDENLRARQKEALRKANASEEVTQKRRAAALARVKKIGVEHTRTDSARAKNAESNRRYWAEMTEQQRAARLTGLALANKLKKKVQNV